VSEIDEILKAPVEKFKEQVLWQTLDKLIEPLPEDQRILEWNRVAGRREKRGVSSGHAHFRAGILHLVNDSDETAGIKHLQAAYEQDQKFSGSKEPHRMAAYGVLGLIKDFLYYLAGKKNWQVNQLQPPHRHVLITTLLGVYDESTKHPLDAPLLTYKPFFDLFLDEGLRRFAAENYYCAYGLLEMVSVQNGQSFLHQHEYPLSRALVGLYGGVLEAILADELGIKDEATLGKLINQAYDAGILNLGTRLSSLATVLLYFRNHIHANKDVARKDYLIDINVARSLKAATDLVIIELVQRRSIP
jgi:hypothetical protein